VDPGGHLWSIAARIAAPSEEEIQQAPAAAFAKNGGSPWRKLVGVEPTCEPLTDRTPDLKPGPSTGQD